jgi:hypothetical protein
LIAYLVLSNPVESSLTRRAKRDFPNQPMCGSTGNRPVQSRRFSHDPGAASGVIPIVIEPVNQDRSTLNSEQNDSALDSASLHPSTRNELTFNYTTVYSLPCLESPTCSEILLKAFLKASKAHAKRVRQQVLHESLLFPMLTRKIYGCKEGGSGFGSVITYT